MSAAFWFVRCWHTQTTCSVIQPLMKQYTLDGSAACHSIIKKLLFSTRTFHGSLSALEASMYYFLFPRLYFINVNIMYVDNSLDRVDRVYDFAFIAKWCGKIIVTLMVRGFFNYNFIRMSKLDNFRIPLAENLMSLAQAHVLVPHATISAAVLTEAWMIFGDDGGVRAAAEGDAFLSKFTRWLLFVAVDTVIVTALSFMLFFMKLFDDASHRNGAFGR